MPESSVLAPILLGGIGGAVVSFVLQSWRDYLGNRRKSIAAERIVRAEIVRNMSVVQIGVSGHALAPHSKATYRRDAFDRFAYDLVPDLNETHMAALVTFYALHETVEAMMWPALPDPADRHWLEETWLPLADTAHVILAFAADPWWARIRRLKTWRELQKHLRSLDAESAAPGE